MAVEAPLGCAFVRLATVEQALLEILEVTSCELYGEIPQNY